MEKTLIKTGIFGGTFNPIHIGHLALANYVCEYGGVDEIWFLVSPQNPFKKDLDLLDGRIRLEMVEASVREYPRFRASGFEFDMPCPSYTIDTLNRLSEVYPGREFILIIGADNWEIFGCWKASDEILRRYRVLVYPRVGHTLFIPDTENHVKEVRTPLIEVSSTFIRHAFANGKDPRFFLHPEVYRIIREKRLYINDSSY